MILPGQVDGGLGHVSFCRHPKLADPVALAPMIRSDRLLKPEVPERLDLNYRGPRNRATHRL